MSRPELVRRRLARAVPGAVDGQPAPERLRVRGVQVRGPEVVVAGRHEHRDCRSQRRGRAHPDTRFISPMMSSTLERRVSANRERTKASRLSGDLVLVRHDAPDHQPGALTAGRNQLSQPMTRTPRNACPGSGGDVSSVRERNSSGMRHERQLATGCRRTSSRAHAPARRRAGTPRRRRRAGRTCTARPAAGRRRPTRTARPGRSSARSSRRRPGCGARR